MQIRLQTIGLIDPIPRLGTTNGLGRLAVRGATPTKRHPHNPGRGYYRGLAPSPWVQPQRTLIGVAT
jgi:hypothetical protein